MRTSTTWRVRRSLVAATTLALSCVAVLTLGGGSPAEAAGSSLTAYVANFTSGTVTPINTATNTTEPVIGVGADPQKVAITPNGATAYVTNRGSNTVTPD